MTARFKGIEELRALAVSEPDSIVRRTAETLSNLEGLGRKMKAVAHIPHEDAMAVAEKRSSQPDRSGALFGIPMAHKDLYMRKGWPCEGGSKTLSGNRAVQTAFSIAQLDHAGAIDCGRLTVVEFGLGPVGHNTYAGTPNNPWNPDYICGGSSSGSGAVVAAGIVTAALGTDTGGSIRLPAAACGLVGIKPTHGLAGRSGVIALSPTLDSVGPLTRSVRDGAIVLQELARLDDRDSSSIPVVCPDYLEHLEQGIKGLRLGWPSNHFFENTESSVARNVESVFHLAGQLGAECVDVVLPGIESANAMNLLITAVEAAALHEKTILEHHAEFGEQSLARILVGSYIPARDYHNALANRDKTAKRILAETFKRVDVVITPVWPYPLPTIAETDLGANPEAADLVFQSGHNVRPFNYLGFPAVTLPTGFDANGLPSSVQLIGAPYTEANLLRTARSLERELDFWSASPQLAATTT
jgi:aspartyl-tRNA(Asn)/glutamyl-tRNA(Gln) amidotransferase subunit A